MSLRSVFPALTAAFLAAAVLFFPPSAAPADAPPSIPRPVEGNYVIPNYRFGSGETLPELRLHFHSLGKPHRNAHGRVDNAVLILHGTGGSGRSFLVDRFAQVLFGKGQLLDINRYYIILPDGIGHGDSSKPSDGLHAHFPQYDYDDMVTAQHELLLKGLQVDHLRLVLGT
jgi:homoserine O-acetyltransferase